MVKADSKVNMIAQGVRRLRDLEASNISSISDIRISYNSNLEIGGEHSGHTWLHSTSGCAIDLTGEACTAFMESMSLTVSFHLAKYQHGSVYSLSAATTTPTPALQVGHPLNHLGDKGLDAWTVPVCIMRSI